MILSCLLTWTRSVLWQHIVTRCVCVCVCVRVCVCSSLCAFIYRELHTPTKGAVITPTLSMSNGHDRIILVIFSQALYKAPC